MSFLIPVKKNNLSFKISMLSEVNVFFAIKQ